MYCLNPSIEHSPFVFKSYKGSKHARFENFGRMYAEFAVLATLITLSINRYENFHILRIIHSYPEVL
jgi:hypothetical protein